MKTASVRGLTAWLGLLIAVATLWVWLQRIHEQNEKLVQLRQEVWGNEPFLETTKMTAGPRGPVGLRTLSLTLMNVGREEAVDIAVSMTGDQRPVSATLTSIPAGGSATVSLSAGPLDASTYRGTIRYADRAGDHGTRAWCFGLDPKSAAAVLDEAEHQEQEMHPCSP